MTAEDKGEDRSKGGLRAPFPAPVWHHRRGILKPAGHPLVMGIINTTPDSFYAGSRHEGVQSAVTAALQMVADGADVLDLGAESSRPGSDPVDSATEQERLLPILEALRKRTDIPITVDTVRSDTARAALDAGADAINDISAGLMDPHMLPLAAEYGCGLILMHMQGMPRSMQDSPHYDDVIAEVANHLKCRAQAAEKAGINAACIMIDPGIGFGKQLSHNLTLLNNLGAVAGGRPMLLGASRKSFIAGIGLKTGVSLPPADRLAGSLAALVPAFDQGISMVRVHDVAASIQFFKVLKATAEETC
jgi:dihydropteroate synthase